MQRVTELQKPYCLKMMKRKEEALKQVLSTISVAINQTCHAIDK